MTTGLRVMRDAEVRVTDVGKAMVRPISYLRAGDVVIAEARQDGELASPLTVRAIERDAFSGTYRIIWAGLGVYGFTGWHERETLYVFLRP